MSDIIWPAALSVGVMLAAGLYLFFSGSIQRMVFGFIVLSNAVNLSVIASGGLPIGAVAALIKPGESPVHADPLPQAFILTAIVIGLAAMVFLLSMAVRYHKEAGSDRDPTPGDAT